MIKVLRAERRHESLDRATFRDRWRTVDRDAPAAVRPLAASTGFAVALRGAEAPYDVVAVTWFADAAHRERHEGWRHDADADDALVRPGEGLELTVEPHAIAGGGAPGRLTVWGFFARAEGTTREQCLRYWRHEHAALALEAVPPWALGLAYVQNHVTDPAGPIDGAAEFVVADVDALYERARFFRSDAYEVLKADEARFMDRASQQIVIVETES